MKTFEQKVSELEMLNLTYISEDNNLFKVKCHNGHVFERSFADIKKSNGFCNECNDSYYTFVKRIKKLKEYNLDHISHNGTLYKLKCENGHIFEKDYHYLSIKNFVCDECDSTKNTKNKRLNKLKALGYIILEEDKYNIKLKCEKGHVFEVNLFCFAKTKSDCPECKKRS